MVTEVGLCQAIECGRADRHADRGKQEQREKQAGRRVVWKVKNDGRYAQKTEQEEKQRGNRRSITQVEGVRGGGFFTQ
jgi:hypothetical protein